MVFSGLLTACRLATWPTRRSLFLVNATTDGVVRAPSWLGITTGVPPSITDTTELVVPRSMPIILLMIAFLSSVRVLLRYCLRFRNEPNWPRRNPAESPERTQEHARRLRMGR